MHISKSDFLRKSVFFLSLAPTNMHDRKPKVSSPPTMSLLFFPKCKSWWIIAQAHISDDSLPFPSLACGNCSVLLLWSNFPGHYSIRILNSFASLLNFGSLLYLLRLAQWTRLGYMFLLLCLPRQTHQYIKIQQKPFMFLIVSRYRLQDAINISIPLFALSRLERWSHGESLKSRYDQNASMTIRWL